jgi:hypothetical protein
MLEKVIQCRETNVITFHILDILQKVIMKLSKTEEIFVLTGCSYIWNSSRFFTWVHCFFLSYINYLSLNINQVPIPVLLADDTSVMITISDISHLVDSSNFTFIITNKHFMANGLSLNLLIKQRS